MFNELVDASTFAAAEAVLQPQGDVPSPRKQLERELLAAWLNFANGAVEWVELIDTNHDGAAETPFNAVVYAAESVRLNPAATDAEVRDQQQILHRVNAG